MKEPRMQHLSPLSGFIGRSAYVLQWMRSNYLSRCSFSGVWAADCVWGYFKNNLLLQTGALVRCRYLSSAGFLSQTSDFPHIFPLSGPDRKNAKSQQSLAREKRLGQAVGGLALFHVHAALSCWRRRPRLSLRAAGRAPAAGLWAVKTAPLFVQQKAQLLGPYQNQLHLTFTSLFLAQRRRARALSFFFFFFGCFAQLHPRPEGRSSARLCEISSPFKILHQELQAESLWK